MGPNVKASDAPGRLDSCISLTFEDIEDADWPWQAFAKAGVDVLGCR